MIVCHSIYNPKSPGLATGTTTASMPMPFAANSRRMGRTLLATISMQILPSAISTTGSAPSRLTYKTITIMQYILIVALEFVLAFTGVALLIRYYNHKA